MPKSINEIVSKYYNEACCGIVNKSPSYLNRGEGTEVEYYIFKIDLVGSTSFIRYRRLETYLKLAHTFLSTVHEITQNFGADNDQIEYVGDGIIAYFKTSKVMAIEVLKAAYFCREATLAIKRLDATLGKFPFMTKCVLHCGQLIVAKIGPRGESFASAIGPDLHKACKMESRAGSGVGIASQEFRNKLMGKEKFLLSPNYTERQVLKEINSPLGSSPTSLLDALRQPMPIGMLNTLSQKPPVPPVGPIYETKKEIVDYSIKWELIPRFLQL